jgi:hypothetical protein
MSESAGRVCAWAITYADAGTIITQDRGDAGFAQSEEYKVTPLVPEQLLVDAEREREEFGHMHSRLAIQCFHQEIELADERKKLAAVRALADEWEMDGLELGSVAEDKYERATAANLDNAAKRLRALTEKSEETR